MKPSAISVAICTRDHPGDLSRCLQSLSAARERVLEIIVVDNDSKGDETRKLAEAFGARWVREPVVGLEAARNCAIASARGEVIAFIDDDCEVARGWEEAIAEAFDNPQVGCVTGQARAGAGANWVQRQFDSFARGFCVSEAVEASPSTVGGVYYRAVRGVGANISFRLQLLRELGGFRLVTCGEEDYMQYKVVRSGNKVRYTPRAVVYQKHRDTLGPTLRRQFQYGVGAMRVIWQLSAEERSFGQFAKNTAWIYLSGLRSLAGALVRARFWHVVFRLTDLAGLTVGLFLPWGWYAHLSGKLPARGRMHPFPGKL